jgi:hypothetical protein
MDAANIAREIQSEGLPIEYFHLDIADPSTTLREHYATNPLPTHLYYFATPHIFDGLQGHFSPSLFDRFSRFYVHGLWQIFSSLQAMGNKLKYIFYPSTVALDDPPVDMMEYVAAKAAGEALCAAIKRRFAVRVHCPRLPRVATDQTASLYPVKNEDPLQVLVNHLEPS